MSERMRRLECGNDALEPAEKMEGLDRLVVGRVLLGVEVRSHGHG